MLYPEESLGVIGECGTAEHLEASPDVLVAVLICADMGKGLVGFRCAKSASLSGVKAEDMHWSTSKGEEGESIALPSEETGLAQRPSPCRYRMHFFFLLRTVKRVICK